MISRAINKNTGNEQPNEINEGLRVSKRKTKHQTWLQLLKQHLWCVFARKFFPPQNQFQFSFHPERGWSGNFCSKLHFCWKALDVIFHGAVEIAFDLLFGKVSIWFCFWFSSFGAKHNVDVVGIAPAVLPEGTKHFYNCVRDAALPPFFDCFALFVARLSMMTNRRSIICICFSETQHSWGHFRLCSTDGNRPANQLKDNSASPALPAEKASSRFVATFVPPQSGFEEISDHRFRLLNTNTVASTAPFRMTFQSKWRHVKAAAVCCCFPFSLFRRHSHHAKAQRSSKRMWNTKKSPAQDPNECGLTGFLDFSFVFARRFFLLYQPAPHTLRSLSASALRAFWEA